MFRKFGPFLFVLFSVIFFLNFNQVFASTSGLVIDEFKVSGDAGSYDEYIIIANQGLEDIDLSNYTLKKKTATGRKYNLFTFPAVTIGSESKLILAGEGYLGEKDYSYTNSIAPDNAIVLYDPTGNVVDLVGYGEVVDFEGKALQNPEINDIYQRAGGLDTDNNFNDFILLEPKSVVDINADKLMFTEIVPNPEEGDEWFEIYNPTNLEISLFGLKVCDGSGRIHCYSFKENETVPPYSYVAFEQNKTKITLNNDGDWLEIIGDNDLLITDSGDNYGDSDKGDGYALFLSGWSWTSTPTKASENMFTDIIEVETTKVKKTVKKTSARKTTNATSADNENNEEGVEEDNSEVKGESTKDFITDNKGKISQSMVGYGIIGLAIAILLGYTLWENKEKISETYKRIRGRNN